MSSGSARERLSREVAWRVFAREYNDADLSFKEGEDERAPNYVVTPTGAKINRLFVVGVVTEVENIGDQDDLYRARVSDPTGAFVVYAGQYQPDAMSFLADLNPPEFVAVVGKARTYQPEDANEVYTSVRPEEVNVVDGETRDRWTVEAARQTLERIEGVRRYLRSGEQDPVLHDLGETVDHYGVDEEYLDGLKSEVLEVVRELAGEEEGREMQAGVEKRLETEADEEEVGLEGSGDGGGDGRGAGEVGAEPGKEAEVRESAESDEFDGEDEEWEWGEGERREVEEEFGAEFESAAEIEEKEAGEAGTEAASEEVVEDTGEEEGVPDEPVEPGVEEEGVVDEEDQGPGGSPEEVVMSVIERESGDDGVERGRIVSLSVEEGLSEEKAEDTLEELLLEGMCYPTDGDRIKPL